MILTGGHMACIARMQDWGDSGVDCDTSESHASDQSSGEDEPLPRPAASRKRLAKISKPDVVSSGERKYVPCLIENCRKRKGNGNSSEMSWATFKYHDTSCDAVLLSCLSYYHATVWFDEVPPAPVLKRPASERSGIQSAPSSDLDYPVRYSWLVTCQRCGNEIMKARLFPTFCGIFRVHRDFLILILHQIDCPWNSWKQAFPVSPKGPNRSNPSKLGAQQLYQPTFLPRYHFFRPFWCGLFVFCWQQLQMLRCSLLDNRYCPPSQVFNHRIVSCGKFRYRALRGYWLPKLPKSENKGNKDNHELFGRGGRGDRSKGKSCQVRLPSPGRWDVRRAKDRKKERRSGTKFLRFFKFVLLDWVEWVCWLVSTCSASCQMWYVKFEAVATCDMPWRILKGKLAKVQFKHHDESECNPEKEDMKFEAKVRLRRLVHLRGEDCGPVPCL